MSIREIYSICVIKLGISPDYFWKMQDYELEVLIDNYFMKSQEEWEMCRNLYYAIVQTQSTKELNIKKLMSFPWDREEINDEKGDSKEDIKAMMEEVNKYTEKLNNKI